MDFKEDFTAHCGSNDCNGLQDNTLNNAFSEEVTDSCDNAFCSHGTDEYSTAASDKLTSADDSVIEDSSVNEEQVSNAASSPDAEVNAVSLTDTEQSSDDEKSLISATEQAHSVAIRRKKAVSGTKKLIVIAVFSAISFLLYYLGQYCKMPTIFPSWLDFQISELPAVLVGFMFGPISGSAVIIIKCLLKMPLSGTMFVGEAADIILGLALVVPASLIYKKNKDKKSALIGLLVGVVCSIAVSVLSNRFMLVPLFVKVFFGGDIELIAAACSTLFPKINGSNFYTYYLLLSVIPFNILRCAVTGIITFLVYKRLSKVIKKFVS